MEMNMGRLNGKVAIVTGAGRGNCPLAKVHGSVSGHDSSGKIARSKSCLHLARKAEVIPMPAHAASQAAKIELEKPESTSRAFARKFSSILPWLIWVAAHEARSCNLVQPRRAGA
jgi:hypothetical protein